MMPVMFSPRVTTSPLFAAAKSNPDREAKKERYEAFVTRLKADRAYAKLIKEFEAKSEQLERKEAQLPQLEAKETQTRRAYQAALKGQDQAELEAFNKAEEHRRNTERNIGALKEELKSLFRHVQLIANQTARALGLEKVPTVKQLEKAGVDTDGLLERPRTPSKLPPRTKLPYRDVTHVAFRRAPIRAKE